ncbi:nascent polypeptide-associated complex subunit alpha, muscle-specific form-like [Penaeus indicus]|uniref:nascent polypeptide-associated complex subunit alpha, muscle-specific form-like n=1 Tax=Penaeus indicus TaxID=29960 RepID=UPI00300D354C
MIEPDAIQSTSRCILDCKRATSPLQDPSRGFICRYAQKGRPSPCPCHRPCHRPYPSPCYWRTPLSLSLPLPLPLFLPLPLPPSLPPSLPLSLPLENAPLTVPAPVPATVPARVPPPPPVPVLVPAPVSKQKMPRVRRRGAPPPAPATDKARLLTCATRGLHPGPATTQPEPSHNHANTQPPDLAVSRQQGSSAVLLTTSSSGGGRLVISPGAQRFFLTPKLNIERAGPQPCNPKGFKAAAPPLSEGGARRCRPKTPTRDRITVEPLTSLITLPQQQQQNMNENYIPVFPFSLNVRIKGAQPPHLRLHLSITPAPPTSHQPHAQKTPNKNRFMSAALSTDGPERVDSACSCHGASTAKYINSAAREAGVPRRWPSQPADASPESSEGHGVRESPPPRESPAHPVRPPPPPPSVSERRSESGRRARATDLPSLASR